MNQGHLPNGDDFGSKHPHAALHSPYLGTTHHDVQKVEQSQALKKRVSLIPWSELRDEPVRWLVDGLIPANSFVAIFGKPGAYKSFLALGAAAAIASGTEFLGRETTQGSVVYIAAEGSAGLRRRRDSILKHHNLPPDLPIWFLKAALNLATTTEDLDALIAEIKGLNISPSLIVLDTWARVTNSAEENSASEMGAAIAICGELQAQTGAAVLIVHHSSKGSEQMRGSSAILAAVDAELYCEKLSAEGSNERLGRLKITKMKDGVDDVVIPFKAVSVQLSPIDETQTSLAIELADETEVAGLKGSARIKLNDDAQKMLEALRKGIAEAGTLPPFDRAGKGTKVITESLWREYYRMSTSKKGGTERQAWSRGYKQLERANAFGFWADYVWITKEPEPMQAPARQSQALETYDDIPFP